MNKKNLSVVMAGAMLATSVAPVLAATETTIPSTQVNLLVKSIKEQMDSKKISADSRLVTDFKVKACSISGHSSDGLPENHGESVYGVKLVDENGKVIKDFNNGEICYDSSKIEGDSVGQLEKVIKDNPNCVVKVYERANTEFLGQYITSTAPTVDSTQSVSIYNGTDIENISKIINLTTVDSASISKSTAEGYKGLVTVSGLNVASTDTLNPYIVKDSAELGKTEAGLDTVTFELVAESDLTNPGKKVTVTLTAGQPVLNFGLAVDKDGKLLSTDGDSGKDLQKVAKFLNDTAYKAGSSTALTAEPTEISSTKVTEAANGDENLVVSDLYDGFALTAKGTEIASDLKNASENGGEAIGADSQTSNLVQLQYFSGNVTGTNGVYSFTVKYFDTVRDITSNSPLKTITVRSTNAKEIQSLYNMLKNGSFNVGIIGGSNRYETAVNVAKARGIKTATNTADGDNNIVLVNGTSLVDGLAAAPLAASLTWDKEKAASGDTNKKSAPLLLAESDKLPTATKEYIKEITSNIAPADRKNVKIHLVGGESVLSSSLVNELKDMGFTSITRYGGDNREETSIEVAEAIDATGKANHVFVVGGNGEADAMSIAPVASSYTNGESNNTVAPIIVSSVHGITRDGLKYLENQASSGEVTIIGGENVVSKEEQTKINEVLDKNKPSIRIAGANREETNAKIIKEFYGSSAAGIISGSTAVINVKDGKSDKSELIDALAAANFAAQNSAPVVLASKSVTADQKTALLGIDKTSLNNTTGKVAQVGIGASRTVLETIANLFNISNTK